MTMDILTTNIYQQRLAQITYRALNLVGKEGVDIIAHLGIVPEEMMDYFRLELSYIFKENKLSMERSTKLRTTLEQGFINDVLSLCKDCKPTIQ